MVKSFILIMLSIALSYSMIVPAVNVLMDLKLDSVVLIDFSEEEPNHSEKEIDEKDVVFITNLEFEPYWLPQPIMLNGFYKEDMSMFDKKVFLPPPKCIS